MSVTTRVAIVAFFVCILGAVASLVLPTSPQGANCGTWLAPEWTDSGTAEIVDGTEALREQSLDPELSEDGTSMAYAAVTSKRLCDDALGTRRTVSLVLLGMAVIVPAGVVFVGRGRSERSDI